ncbi:T9SS type A sorting domain-containing protein [Bacteroidota bacterium]
MFWTRIILPVILILPAFITGNSQDFLSGVSNDTLIAGKSNTFLVHMGKTFDPGQVEARLTFNGPCFNIGDSCEICPMDTIWESDIQLHNDTVASLTFDIPTTAFPSEHGWTLEIPNHIYYSPMILITEPVIYGQPADLTVFTGATAQFGICSYGSDTLYYDWFRTGDSISKGEGRYFEINYVSESDSGGYYCRIRRMLLSEVLSTVYSDTAYLSIMETSTVLPKPEGPTSNCYNGDSVVYKVSASEVVKDYQWSLVPGNAGNYQTINDTLLEVHWNESFSGRAGIVVSGNTMNDLTLVSDTLWVIQRGIPEQQSICIVGIDDETQKCRIVWEESIDPGIVSYDVHGENQQAGVFDKLATYSPIQFSVFIDTGSTPNFYPHTYMLTATDTCGNISRPGVKHTTILLSSNLGTSGQHFLIWSEYRGITFPSYHIYHGTHKDSMNHLATVTGTVLNYNVTNPLPGSVYYQIEATRAEACVPSKKSAVDYSSTHSNIEGIVGSSSTRAIHQNQPTISPNPASQSIQIHYSGPITHGTEIMLFNLLGKEKMKTILKESLTTLDVSELKPGIYILHIRDPGQNHLQKLIIQ